MAQKSRPRWYKKLKDIFSSKWFFVFVVTLAVVQGLWYAFSFQPGMFDERAHINFIDAYSQRSSPFITNQDPSLDHLGEVTREPNYLFYYLLSIPYKIISLVTDNQTVKILALRVLMVACFAAGLLFFRKVLTRAKTPSAVSSVGLLFVVLTPTIAPLIGTINYDSIIFMLFPLMLIFALRVTQSKQLDIVSLVAAVSIGLLGSLVKFSFVALAAPVFIYLLYELIRIHGKKLWPAIQKSFGSQRILVRIALVLVVVVSVGLFVERPLQNLARYGQMTPACQQILPESRCKNFGIAKRNLKLLAEKPVGFRPLSPYDYTLVFWVPSMITTQTRVFSLETPVLGMQFVYYAFALFGLVITVYYLRDYLKNRIYVLLMATAVSYAAILLINNYLLYKTYAVPIAMNGRYLLPIMPILFTLVAWSTVKWLAPRFAWLLVTGFVVTLLFFTQGGGLATTILTFPEIHYWQAGPVKTLNRTAKSLLGLPVYKLRPFQRF